MTEEQLSALLRIKRFEQPPPQYFDRLLQDLHRRQRTELLRRPLWKIAVERVQTFFSEHSMGHLSYAGALASVLVVGVTAIGLMTPGDRNETTASAKPAAESKVASNIGTAPTPAFGTEKLVTLQTKRRPVLDSASSQTAPLGYEPADQQPRYVIDARPATYEPPSTF
jgi:hypothetical protein